MIQLPQFIQRALDNNTTSLGKHPAFPPEDEDVFEVGLIRNMYKNVMSEIETNDKHILSNKLNELITICQKEEESCKEALEKLCSDVVSKLFDIPQDTITINGKICNECNIDDLRVVPESTPDFEFDDIEEMKHLTDIIYQRRMLNCLISGMSSIYANSIDLYVSEIWKINPKLIELYAKINKYNLALLYNQPDSIKNVEMNKTGCVRVLVGDKEERVEINAEGVIFPVLLEYSIKGILETASLNSLPADNTKAEYITGKTDYRLAENWDLRFGIPLWMLLNNKFNKLNVEPIDLGLNFIIMEMSLLKPDEFNKFMQNTFKGTKLGMTDMSNLAKYIQKQKDMDDFHNFIDIQNKKYAINDDEMYTAEELLSECDE